MSYNFNCNNDFSIFATETKTTMLEQQFSSLIIILFETEITVSAFKMTVLFVQALI